MGALNAGVPMLAIPQGADQFMNAEAIAQVGAGLRLLPTELSAAAVRDAAQELLGDRRFADVASGEQAAIRDMPTPESVVPKLEALV